MSETQLEREDLELVDTIENMGFTRDQAKNIVTHAVLPWVSEQISWGGKYDYLLEMAHGEDT